MKNLLLYLALCSSLAFTHKVICSENTEILNADDWIKTYLINNKGALVIDRTETQVLLNLLYLSYARSNATLEAQDDALHDMQTAWQVMQNIIQLRRNPSKDLPYSIDEKTYKHDLSQLYKLQTTHRILGKAYAHAVEMIFKEKIIKDDRLMHGLNALRKYSRVKMIKALTDVREYLDAIFHTRNMTDDANNSLINSLTKSFSIKEYIWSLMPNLAFDSFVKTDNITVSMSEEWWKALCQLLNMSNMIWKSIERARATLYLDYYTKVYTYFEKQGTDMSTITLMFDEYGMVTEEGTHEPLPRPENLKVAA